MLKTDKETNNYDFPWVKARQFCKSCGFDIRTIMELSKQGKFKGLSKIGRNYYLNKSEFLEFVKGNCEDGNNE